MQLRGKSLGHMAFQPEFRPFFRWQPAGTERNRGRVQVTWQGIWRLTGNRRTHAPMSSPFLVAHFGDFWSGYHLVMTNSSPWYRWPVEIDGLPFLIAWWIGGSFHGYASHNQMVTHVNPTKKLSPPVLVDQVTSTHLVWFWAGLHLAGFEMNEKLSILLSDPIIIVIVYIIIYN